MAQREPFTSVFQQTHQRGRVLLIAQMPALGRNARFQIIWIRPRHEHIIIIIGFQRHHIRQQEVRQHLVAHIAKVCCDACHPAQRRGDAVTPAGHRVVARFKALHRKTAHVLGAAVDVYQFRARRHKAPASQIIQRGRAAVHRHRVIF